MSWIRHHVGVEQRGKHRATEELTWKGSFPLVLEASSLPRGHAIQVTMLGLVQWSDSESSDAFMTAFES